MWHTHIKHNYIYNLLVVWIWVKDTTRLYVPCLGGSFVYIHFHFIKNNYFFSVSHVFHQAIRAVFGWFLCLYPFSLYKVQLLFHRYYTWKTTTKSSIKNNECLMHVWIPAWMARRVLSWSRDCGWLLYYIAYFTVFIFPGHAFCST